MESDIHLLEVDEKSNSWKKGVSRQWARDSIWFLVFNFYNFYFWFTLQFYFFAKQFSSRDLFIRDSLLGAPHCQEPGSEMKLRKGNA